MAIDFSDAELLGYLDEALAVERMTTIETALRGSDSLRRRLAELCGQRDRQGPSPGDVWRQSRLSCPTRQQLGSYLLGALSSEWSDYVEFHIQTVGCRFCSANLEDLRTASRPGADGERRRRKFFESSAGYMRKRGVEEVSGEW